MMRVKLTPLKIFVTAAVVGLGGWLLFRYFDDPNGSGTAELNWLESVQLASGETIWIRRHVQFTQHFMLGTQVMSAKRVVKASIELDPLRKDFPIWEAPLQPIYLDRDPDNGDWIIVAGEDGSSLWPWNGQPCPPQWAFRLRGGVWYLQPVPENALGRRANLLVDIRIDDDRQLARPPFQSIVKLRKVQQFDTLAHATREEQFVGGNISVENYCKKSSQPAFTREFLFQRSGPRNLEKFPRIP